MAKASNAIAERAPTPIETACSAADELARAAAECARQHERLGRCLELTCSDQEAQNIAELAALSDEHLETMAAEYEKCATAAPDVRTQEWFHAANALWHASREYARRSAGTDHASRLAGKHAKKKLTELAMEYELERSALLALKQSLAGFRAVRPGRD
jgi:hypothetical protein